MYWCAVQQQTSTFRRKKSSSIYSKFSVGETSLPLASKIHWKWLKIGKNQTMLKKRKYKLIHGYLQSQNDIHEKYFHL